MTKGELDYMKLAFDYYAQAMKKEIIAMEKDGKRSIFAPDFFQMMLDDLHNKCGMWTRPVQVFEEEDDE